MQQQEKDLEQLLILLIDNKLNTTKYTLNPREMIIFALHGHMGVGKDYITHTYMVSYIRERYPKLRYMFLSFADQLKVNVMVRYNLDVNQVYGHKTPHVRNILQQEGTELGRDVLGDDIWIKYYDKWLSIYESRGIDIVFTCDVRYMNEYLYLRSKPNVYIIKIIAPNRTLQLYKKCNLNHSSEISLDNRKNISWDIVLNNDIDVDNNLKDLKDLKDNKDILENFIENAFLRSKIKIKND